MYFENAKALPPGTYNVRLSIRIVPTVKDLMRVWDRSGGTKLREGEELLGCIAPIKNGVYHVFIRARRSHRCGKARWDQTLGHEVRHALEDVISRVG